MKAPYFIRMGGEAALVFIAWRHTHWSVGVVLTLMTIAIEIMALQISRIIKRLP